MLDELLRLLIEDRVITKEICQQSNIDRILDLRDIPEFDSEWIRVDEQIETISIDDRYKEIIKTIAKEAFMKAYNFSKSSDFASCVSDDFELIVKARIINYSDKWLNALIYSYAKDEFPCGKLNENLYELDNVWKKLIEKGN